MCVCMCVFVPGVRGVCVINGMYDADHNSFDFLFSLVAANITEMPVNQTVTSPDDATFSCTASGLPRPNITWTSPDSVTLVSGVNDTTITEDDSGGERSLVSTLYIINASPSSSGEYTCNADNTVGRGDTLIMATASLTVYGE